MASSGKNRREMREDGQTRPVRKFSARLRICVGREMLFIRKKVRNGIIGVINIPIARKSITKVSHDFLRIFSFEDSRSVLEIILLDHMEIL
jgi:hypothetical protein